MPTDCTGHDVNCTFEELSEKNHTNTFSGEYAENPKLLGRPKRVEKSVEYVTIWMEDRPPNVSWSKGMPKPPDVATIYKVFIGMKQWKRVEAASRHSDDRLIIEGVAAHDDKNGGVVIFASSVSSVMLEEEKRTKQKGTA